MGESCYTIQDLDLRQSIKIYFKNTQAIYKLIQEGGKGAGSGKHQRDTRSGAKRPHRQQQRTGIRKDEKRERE